MAKQTNGCHRTRSLHPQLRGSLQKFCTLYVSSLKLNLFYKTHFQAFNVISIVLYHSSPTFGQVLYSRQDAFVVDASDYLGHLIRHLPKASEAFPMDRFLQFWEQKTGGLMSELYGGWGRTCHPYFSKISDTAPEAWGCALMYDLGSLRKIRLQSVSSSISRLRFAEHGPRSLPKRTQCSLLKSGSQLSRKSEWLHHPTGRASAVCRTFETPYICLVWFGWSLGTSTPW